MDSIHLLPNSYCIINANDVWHGRHNFVAADAQADALTD